MEGDTFTSGLHQELHAIMKKVLIFSLNYYPFVGGAEVAVKEITDRLPAEQYEFHILVPHYDANLPKEEVVGRVHAHRFGFKKAGATISDQSRYPLKLNKYYYQMRAAAEAEKLHRTHHFDLMWGMMAHATGIPAGMFKTRHPEIPYLLTLQEGDPLEYIERLMKPVWRLFKQGFTKADGLQAISNFLLAWGKRMGCTGVAEVIPNGVDIARFTAPRSEEEIAAMKHELGKGERDVFLVTTSRLVHKNAADDVIRAMPLLAENISFLVYGIGPDEAMLRALAQELNVEARVRFMGQAVHEDLPRILSACDIFIRPSRSEGMGNSFIEAMAAGIPVIATREGGIPDFLIDAKHSERPATGFAVLKDSPQEIAVTVNHILSNQEEVSNTVANARALVSERYDWNTIAKQMQDLFARLLA